MSAAFVLDASATLSWFFEDELDEYGQNVKEAFAAGADVIVPPLWAIETTLALATLDVALRTVAEKSGAKIFSA